jgi:hypothetical protein
MSENQLRDVFKRKLVLFMPTLRKLSEQGYPLNELRHKGTNYDTLYRSADYHDLKKLYGERVYNALYKEVNNLIIKHSLLPR